jgi:hypothetical protein
MCVCSKGESMKAQNDIRKQATTADVEGFINTLTLLLEGDRLSDSTKETLRATLCNAANTAGEGDTSSPENIRVWLADALNIDAMGAAYKDEDEHSDEEDAFVIFQDEAESRRSIDCILQGITQQGLYDLANILVKLRELTDEGPQESKKASAEIGRILELVFRHSRSYRQALRLYTNRFDIIGGGDPDEHISHLVDGLLEREEVITVEQ